MKKIIPLLLIVLAGCNNNNTKDKHAKSNGDSANDKATTQTSTTGGACGKLILFRQGAVIEGTSYNAAGKVTAKQITTVKEVKEEGTMLVARSSAVIEEAGAGKNMELVYKCDGRDLYMDMTPLMENFGSLKNKTGEIKPIEFPIDILEGQTLPDASYTVTMGKAPIMMDITVMYKNRTVSAKENVTTPAGSWECFKVHCNIESDVKGLDERSAKILTLVKNSTKMEMTMWFSPAFGIVKSETYKAGKLSSRTEITSVKE